MREQDDSPLALIEKVVNRDYHRRCVCRASGGDGSSTRPIRRAERRAGRRDVSEDWRCLIEK